MPMFCNPPRLFALLMLCSGLFWTIPTVASATSTVALSTEAEMSCKVLDPELQITYVGGCLEGLAQGQGIARGHDGVLYQGHFTAGAKAGYGVKLYANGDAYAGDWLQDFRHGHGVYEFGEQSPWRGDKYVGAWEQDQRHGQGVYQFYPTGESFKANWFAGQTDAFASPMLIRRQRAYEALRPVLGQVGVRVCSNLTDGASPELIAQGEVVAVEGERIQVWVQTTEVLSRSRELVLNPRWDLMTEWMVCAS